jgi:hypothetical protein
MDTKSLNSRVFYFAQVIDNKDSDNLNRIKVRIPVIDDDYYVGKTKDEGDKKLPWSVPFSNRFLNVPEVNAIVMVAVFDTKVPHFGRMYFDSFSDFTTSEYFDKLSPEDKLLSNWALIEDVFGINIKGKPKTDGEYNGKDNINYKVGIRGKGKNRILLDKENIEIIQNKDDSKKESKIVISENINVDSSDIIDVKSKKGKKKTYNPVFDDPLFDYLSDINKLFQKIVILLNTVPAISPSGPCTMGPTASQVMTEYTNLMQSLQKFKRDGSSEKININ